MTESSPKVIDQNRFEVTLGTENQAAIFETIAKHIDHTGDIVETIVLGTGSEQFQATVVFYTDDLSRLPMYSFLL